MHHSFPCASICSVIFYSIPSSLSPSLPPSLTFFVSLPETKSKNVLVRFEAACTKSNAPMAERKEGREGGREEGFEDAEVCRRRMTAVRRRGTREAVKVQGRVASRYSCTRVGKEEEEEGEGEGGVDDAEALLGLLLLPLAVSTTGRGRRVGAISYVLCWGERWGRGGRGGRRRGGQCSKTRVGLAYACCLACLPWDRTKALGGKGYQW